MSEPVQQCINNPQVPENQWVNIPHHQKRECIYQQEVAYKIKKNNGKIEIEMGYDFVYSGHQPKSVINDRINSILNCVADFYSKYGIELGVNYKISTPYEARSHYPDPQIPLKVTLHDQIQRADQSNWALYGHANQAVSIENACKVITHELGHSLNLPDEYPDPACPQRQIGPRDSLMHAGTEPHMTPRLYDHLTKKIIEPLCR
jgi:hypothetical protein